ncbi:unnamed protein product [Durusdinium trenchii]|uniref:CRAL-TRIO domain-containing protein n=2 Tax=Durusdinium trenchii TaxID=1381693 RepID=A0ABP0SXQ2_9DINO
MPCYGFLDFCGGRDDARDPELEFKASPTEQDLLHWQYDALLEMRSQVGPVEDKDLLRFLVARKWHVPAAVEQFHAMQIWRKTNQVERWRRNAPGPTGPDAAADAAEDPRLSRDNIEMFPQLRLVENWPDEGAHVYFGQALAFGFDKKGQPIQIQNGGLAGWRFAELLRHVGGREKVVKSLIRFQELQAARMEESSRRLGRPITKQVVITNAAGMPLRPHPQAVATFKDFLFISSRYYPESLAVLFIVNAPVFFVAFYRLIQSWLDPVTASKIQVLGSNFQHKLLEHIDADQLPITYGGTVDFDILGETWSREDCDKFLADCQRALRPDHVQSPSKVENQYEQFQAFPKYWIVAVVCFAYFMSGFLF